MKDKLKIFEYLDTLVKMCHSKNDGVSLKIEEDEITYKIETIDSELNELNQSLKEEIYDESSEMADRNLEIITKKAINTLKTKIKEKSIELEELNNKQKEIDNELAIYKDNTSSYEALISSMQERINTLTDQDTINNYNSLILEKEQNLKDEQEKTNLVNILNKKITSSITNISLDIEEYKTRITKKEELLKEIQTNLQSKDNYIDETKKNRLDKRIKSLEEEKEKYNTRLKEIHKDPKFLETKIKSIINDGADTFLIRGYLIDLINTAMKVPYMNVPLDNNLEAELLKATQARDTFANEIDHKSYAFTDIENPINIRINYLTNKQTNLNKERDILIEKIRQIDNDETYKYNSYIKDLNKIIEEIKQDISEYTITLDNNPNELPSVKAQLKASLDTKKEDLVEAENICDKFRKEQTEYISEINNKYNLELEHINLEIEESLKEIESLTNEQLTKNLNLTDIRLLNKDKERLRDLAKVVVDIKHRKTFPLKPLDIAKELERKLGLMIVNSLDYQVETTEEDTSSTETGSSLINNIIIKNIEEIDSEYPDNDVEEESPFKENKRGLKVTEEIEIPTKNDNPTLEEVEEKYEEHLDTLNKMNEDFNNKTIEEIEEELNITSDIDNNEKDDNITSNQKLIDELDEYIRNLDKQ